MYEGAGGPSAICFLAFGGPLACGCGDRQPPRLRLPAPGFQLPAPGFQQPAASSQQLQLASGIFLFLFVFGFMFIIFYIKRGREKKKSDVSK
jgi:hypothetical protein